MHIDRSRFLLLTASLAALACDQRPGGAASPDTGASEPASSPQHAQLDAGAPTVWLEIEPGSEDAPHTPENCDNSVAELPTCTLSPPSGHCESFYMSESMCRDFPRILQARAAEAAIDCLLAASGTQAICGWESWQQCVSAGLQASCIDASTRQACRSLSSSCGGSINVFMCQQAMSAIKPDYSQHLAGCIQEVCEVASCVGDMRYY